MVGSSSPTHTKIALIMCTFDSFSPSLNLNLRSNILKIVADTGKLYQPEEIYEEEVNKK